METETDAVKLDLAVRFRTDLRRTTETGNSKKLRVMWYTRPQPVRAEHGKIEGRGKCGSHTYGPDCLLQQTLQQLLFLQLLDISVFLIAFMQPQHCGTLG